MLTVVKTQGIGGNDGLQRTLLIGQRRQRDGGDDMVAAFIDSPSGWGVTSRR